MQQLQINPKYICKYHNYRGNKLFTNHCYDPITFKKCPHLFRLR